MKIKIDKEVYQHGNLRVVRVKYREYFWKSYRSGTVTLRENNIIAYLFGIKLDSKKIDMIYKEVFKYLK